MGCQINFGVTLRGLGNFKIARPARGIFSRKDNMAGTKAGGLKASATNKARYGEDYYKRLGKIGGANGNSGGFAANIELAREAGRKGGRISRRNRAKQAEVQEDQEAI